ncbi:MAG TPA: signal peptide peptidase SppA, partial [Cyclobacteriaceae bacterium]|nr:signal peptide peptidase SppA [Cyclobacteriaceae bacterium]
MGFLKTFFASCLGTLVALVALFVLMIAFLSALTSENQMVVSDNSVLHLKLDNPITEQEYEDPISDIYPQAGNQSIGLIQLKQVLINAKTDSKISGIYLNVSELGTGFSTVEEVRNAILDFRLSGKWVIAYSTSYSEGAYYLASASDKVYLFPEGQLEFNGLATEVMFYKKLFDKLEIKPQVFRVGDFKSAVEPFVREDLSEENKLQLNSLLNSIYDQMLTKVSDARKIPKDKLKQISDRMLVRNAKLALENKLVDSLFYEDQVKSEMKSRLGLSDDDDINFVTYARYKKTFSTQSTSANEVAVIVAEGTITSGEADLGIVGSETIVKEIRKARMNDNVKAIVLRINSPGGEFQASDEMWREVTLATAQKPVIASMSDYAASGGYYLAMACDTIVAQPNTITGSIGIFSILFDLSSFLDNKIGLTSEEVK